MIPELDTNQVRKRTAGPIAEENRNEIRIGLGGGPALGAHWDTGSLGPLTTANSRSLNILYP